jgi:hypothetical protein
MAPSLPHFVVIRKRDARYYMQQVDAVIYRQGPWLAVEGNLYKLENYRERSEMYPVDIDIPTPTMSLAIVTGFTYAQHHIFPRRIGGMVRYDDLAHDVFWIDNDNAGLHGTSRPLLVTPQLITIQRWALRYITTKQVKRFGVRLAIAMSLHGRLGAASLLGVLKSDDVMRMICFYY